MEVFSGIHTLHRVLQKPVVVIGNFDGVHLGHQKIIDIAKNLSIQHQSSLVVYTFKPHPQIALRPEKKLKLLTTYEEKNKLLEGLGVDVLIEEPFSREFSTYTPERFFNDVLLSRLDASAIVVGYDFSFGKERTGHIETLESFCKGAQINLTVVPPFKKDEEVVSSTQVRKYLLGGNVTQAAQLLGRYFSYSSIVIKGDGRGRSIGIPTANFSLSSPSTSLNEKLVLPFGVYATKTYFDGKEYISVTNIGVRPTFTHTNDSPPVLVETYLIDQSINLYGSSIEVKFLRHIRDEMKFDSITSLKERISQDIQEARAQSKN